MREDQTRQRMIAVLEAALPCEETGEAICHADKVAETPKLDYLLLKNALN